MRIVVLLALLSLYGCVNFAASVGGTLVGNIASDKVIKEMDKKK
jgi:hypothetical protein